MARSYLWWPGLDKDLENMVKGCQACQSVKKAPLVVPLYQRVHRLSKVPCSLLELTHTPSGQRLEL